MPDSCPTESELKALLAGDPNDDSSGALASHLEGCPSCRERLDKLAGGKPTGLREARACAGGHSIAVARLVAHLKVDRSSTIPVNLSSTDPLLATETANRRMGDYEILSELGRGGMGVVFKARQLSLQRVVALKLILTGQLASESQVRRFRLEAEAAARLDHPNIVPIYEISEHEGRHFFSMKLIEGTSLKQTVGEFLIPPPGADLGPADLPGRQRKLARIMADISRAVHHAHQRGVLHRDLKPANVLVDAQGVPHLTDFGLAKVLQSDSGLTLSQAVMGTPSYMSPEQAAGKTRMITTTSDVYSLGAILYELLTGQPPFGNDEAMVVLNRTVNEEPPPPRAANPAVSRDLEIICLKCLEKETARRLQSAGALADELERFVRGEPIQSRPVKTPERLWRWCRRKPALATALGSLVLVFLLGFAGTLLGWRAEIAQRHLTEAEGRRTQQALTRLEIERAESLFEAGHVSDGLAHLARQLRQEPDNRVVATRLISALSFHAFSLPIAPLHHDSALGSGSPVGEQNLFPFNHEGALAGVNFSPDGRWVVTVGKDGTARVWNAVTGEMKFAPLKHEDVVLMAEFSPDSRKLVTASLDRTARVWDAETGQRLTPPLRHRHVVWFASFSPDSRRVITACEDHTAQLWDAESGSPLGEPFRHEEAVYYAAFGSRPGQFLTASRGAAGGANLWLPRQNQPRFLEHQFRRECSRPFPQLSPDGLWLATNERFEVVLRHLPLISGEEWRLPHETFVTSFEFSSDGKRIATASQDSTAKVWDVQSGKLNAVLRHQDGVLSVNFSPDGQWLLTGSRDKTARLWDVQTGEHVMEPLRHASPVMDTRLSADSHRAVTLTQVDEAWLWDLQRSHLESLVCQHTGNVDIARFSPDGRFVLSLSKINAYLWDLRSATNGQLQLVCPPIQHGRKGGEPQEILDVDFDGTNSTFLTATEHGNARIRDMKTGRAIGNNFTHRRDDSFRETRHHPILSARFSPDGTQMVTASEDGRALVWDVKTGARLHTLRHSNRVSCVRYSRDGAHLVTASRDGTARIWSARTGREVTPALHHDEAVTWAEFDPHGDWVATACRDHQFRIWSVSQGVCVAILRQAEQPAESYPLDFSPDGSLLATAAGDAFQIWRVPDGQAVTPPIKHGGPIRSLRFNPSGIETGGGQIVTAGEDGTARIWDAGTGHQISEPLHHKSAVTYAEFSPDGTLLLTSSWDKTVRIWPVLLPPARAPEWLPELAEGLAGQRILEDNASEVVPVQELMTLRERVQTLPGSDFYTRWRRWFLNGEQSAATIRAFSQVNPK